MRESELLRIIYQVIKQEYKPPKIISGSSHAGKGYFTTDQVNIINSIISEHFNNYDIKYIAFSIVKGISAADPDIVRDISEAADIDNIINRVRPPLLE